MPPRRSAGLIAVVATMTSFLPGAAAAQRAPAEVQAVVAAEPVNLTELRREAEKAAKDLEAATKALEQRRAQIRTSEKGLTTKLREL